MFGAGIYVGNRSKAEMYAKEGGILIRVRVALGRVFQATEAMNKLRKPPQGYDSVQGVRGVTKSWQESTLNHNEWVIYDPCQISVQEIWLP